MADVQHKGTTFYISDDVQANYAELVELVLNTDSMDNQEKQYWFDIMPSMTNTQIDRLYQILDTEKQKLAELESKYQNEIKALNEKNLVDFQDYQSKQTREKVKKEEAKDKDTDPDDVLSMLNDI